MSASIEVVGDPTDCYWMDGDISFFIPFTNGGIELWVSLQLGVDPTVVL